MTVGNISMDCWLLLTRQGQRNWWKAYPVPNFNQKMPHGLPWEWTLDIQGARMVTNCLSQKYTLIKHIELISDKMLYKEVVIHIFLQYDMFYMNDSLITITCNYHFCTQVASMLILMWYKILTTWKTPVKITNINQYSNQVALHLDFGRHLVGISASLLNFSR